jgi:hypothetical protein
MTSLVRKALGRKEGRKEKTTESIVKSYFVVELE